jgi:hypothetical protein
MRFLQGDLQRGPMANVSERFDLAERVCRGVLDNMAAFRCTETGRPSLYSSPPFASVYLQWYVSYH